MPLTQLESYMVNSSGSYTVSTLTATTAVVAAGTSVIPVKITTVQSATSGYVSDSATAVSTSGGYLIITGSGFQSGCQVLIGSTYAAATTFVNSTTLNVQVNATSSGTYPVYVVNTDGSVGVKVPGIVFDAYPVWSTGATLTQQVANVAISINLSATDSNTLTYSVTQGSTLPSGLSLSTSGLLSGTITGITSQTTYTFSIDAVDSVYNEKTARTFSITIIVGEPFFKYTTLLLSGEGTNNANNNTFLDSSSNNFTITRAGNTTQGTFSPYGSNWSNYFNGSSYITLSSAPIAATGSFTFECWVFVTGTAASQNIYGQYLNSDAGRFGIFWNDVANKFTMSIAATSYDSASTYTANTWYHIAWIRDGSNNLSLYVNGVRDYTTTGVNTSLYTGNPIIAARSGGATPYSGYISNLRITNTVVYSGTSFTVPISFLTAISGTSLLTCQTNRFVDNSTNAYTLTVSGTPTVERFSPFSPNSSYTSSTIGGSAYFDGNGDYLSLASNTAFDMGTGNFTLECYYYHVSGSSATYPSIFSSTDWVTGGVGLRYNNLSSNKFQFFWNGVGDPWLSASATSNPFQWNHVALTRSGNNFTLWVNGQSAATGTASGAINFNYNTGGPRIGWGPWDGANGYLKGIISNFRLVKGTALYTASFTPPTAPVTNITGTSLLCDFTNAGIIDGAMMNNLETVGDAKISNVQTKYGTGSMFFDGTGDYLSIPASQNMTFGTGSFTIEFWCYAPAQGTTRTAFIGTDVSYGANFWTIQLNNTSPAYSSRVQLWCYNMNSAAVAVVGSTTLTASTWYHVAVVRNGTAITIYLNGTSDGTGTSSASLDGGVSQAISIAKNSTDYYTGYIDDLRITKGYARYTSNFSSSLPTQLIGQ